MKTIISTLILTITAFASTATAHQSVEESPVVYQAAIETMNVNHHWLNIDPNGSGSIQVDLTNEIVNLTVETRWHCPEGSNCAMVMPKPQVVSLPLVSMYKDGCNNIVYKSEIDKTPVDGLLETLLVIDHSKNNCPTLVALPGTSIEYSTYNPWTSETVQSSFTAGVLELLPSFMF